MDRVSFMNNTPWLIIGGVLVWYLWRPVPQDQVPSAAFNVQREPDLTRWRHDGEQSVEYHDGNRASFVDPTVSELSTKLPGQVPQSILLTNNTHGKTQAAWY